MKKVPISMRKRNTCVLRSTTVLTTATCDKLFRLRAETLQAEKGLMFMCNVSMGTF